MLSTVLVPTGEPGTVNDMFFSLAVFSARLLMAMPIPGRMQPPQYSFFSFSRSKVVAVPESMMIRGGGKQAEPSEAVGDAVGAQLAGLIDLEGDTGRRAMIQKKNRQPQCFFAVRCQVPVQRRYHRRGDNRPQFFRDGGAQQISHLAGAPFFWSREMAPKNDVFLAENGAGRGRVAHINR